MLLFLGERGVNQQLKRTPTKAMFPTFPFFWAVTISINGMLGETLLNFQAASLVFACAPFFQFYFWFEPQATLLQNCYSPKSIYPEHSHCIRLLLPKTLFRLCLAIAAQNSLCYVWLLLLGTVSVVFGNCCPEHSLLYLAIAAQNTLCCVRLLLPRTLSLVQVFGYCCPEHFLLLLSALIWIDLWKSPVIKINQTKSKYSTKTAHPKLRRRNSH